MGKKKFKHNEVIMSFRIAKIFWKLVLTLLFLFSGLSATHAQEQIDVLWPYDVADGDSHANYVVPTTHHTGIFAGATDFRLGLGTSLLAVADGKVVSIVSNVPDGALRSISSLNRCTSDCSVFANGAIRTTRFPLVSGQQDSIGFGQGEIGNYVTIEHISEDGRNYYVSYFHLQNREASNVNLNVNDTVLAGQVIGVVGLTGYRTGAHAHIQAGRTLSASKRVAKSEAQDANLLNYTNSFSSELADQLDSDLALNFDLEISGDLLTVTFLLSENTLQIRDQTGAFADLSPEDMNRVANGARALNIMRTSSPSRSLGMSADAFLAIDSVLRFESAQETFSTVLDFAGIFASSHKISKIDGLSSSYIFDPINSLGVADLSEFLASSFASYSSLSRGEKQKSLAAAADKDVQEKYNLIFSIDPGIAAGSSPISTLTLSDIENAWNAFTDISGSIDVLSVIAGQLGETTVVNDIRDAALDLVGLIPGGTLAGEFSEAGLNLFFDAQQSVDQAVLSNEIFNLIQGADFPTMLQLASFEDISSTQFNLRSGGNGPDILQGTTTKDSLRGRGGNDVFFGGLEDDLIDGGPGDDTAAYNGVRSGFIVTADGHDTYQVSGPEGVDRLKLIELISFGGHFGVPIESVVGTMPNSDPTGGSTVPAANPEVSTSNPDFQTTIDGITSEIVSGDFVTVEFTIKNEGDAYGGVAPLGLYLSDDATPSSGDLLLGAVNISGLSAGQSYSGVISRQTANWGAGSYYIYAVADSDTQNFSASHIGNVVESSESNNKSALVSISMSARPNTNVPDNTPPSTADPIDTPQVQYFSGDIGSTSTTAREIQTNTWVASHIDLGGDADWFQVELQRNERYIILTSEYGADPLSDTFFRVRDANGNILPPTRDVDDTSYGNYDGTLHALLVYTAERTGTHYISVGAGDPANFRNLSGGYVLIVADSDFTARVTGPDLVLTDLDISSRTVSLDQRVTIDFDLENIGNGNADHAEIDFYLSSSAGLSGRLHTLSTWRDSGGLSANGTISEDRNPDIPLDVSPGEYYLVAYVDPDEEVEEAGQGETNNVFVFDRKITVRAPSGPDIDMISNISLNQSIIENGERLTVDWSAENDGDVVSTITDTHFYLSKDIDFDINEDLYLESDTLNDLSPNERDNHDTSLTIPDHAFEGKYYIIAVADGENKVLETDETNNIEESSLFTITDNLRPDLIIRDTELKFDSSEGNTLITGQSLNLKYIIENVGDVDATFDNRNVTFEDTTGERVETFIYLSQDTRYSSDDLFLKAIGEGKMSVNEVNDPSTSFLIPETVPYGDYHILVKADGHGTFPEIYEDNNFGLPQPFSYAAGSPGEGADFFIANLETNGTFFDVGDILEVNFDVFNHGDVEANYHRNDIYLTTDPVFNLNTVILQKSQNGSSTPVGEQRNGGRDFSLSEDLESGSYYIHAITNPDRVTPESNYDNNAHEPVLVYIEGIAPPDTIPPTVSFAPTQLTLGSNETGSVTLTASDDIDDSISPSVVCTNDGSFNTSTNVFSAPVVTVDTVSVCTATATDAAGNAATATLTASIIAPDIAPPTVTFDPADLTLASGETAIVTLVASDTIDGPITPSVVCTNDGNFNTATNVFMAPVVTVDTTSVCTATATDAAGNAATATLTASIIAPYIPAPKRLVYVNGIKTDRAGIIRDGLALSKALRRSNIQLDRPLTLAPNPSGGSFPELVESINQKLAESDIRLDQSTGDLLRTYMPDSVVDELVKDQIAAVIQENPSAEVINNNLSDIRQSVFSEGDELVLISYSQGNLITNSMYEAMSNDEKNVTQLIAVATPSDSISGNGTHTTDLEDLVVRSVPNSLEHNVTNLFEPLTTFYLDILGHDFKKYYLNSGFESEQKITNDIQQAINK